MPIDFTTVHNLMKITVQIVHKCNYSIPVCYLPDWENHPLDYLRVSECHLCINHFSWPRAMICKYAYMSIIYNNDTVDLDNVHRSVFDRYCNSPTLCSC